MPKALQWIVGLCAVVVATAAAAMALRPDAVDEIRLRNDALEAATIAVTVDMFAGVYERQYGEYGFMFQMEDSLARVASLGWNELLPLRDRSSIRLTPSVDRSAYFAVATRGDAECAIYRGEAGADRASRFRRGTWRVEPDGVPVCRRSGGLWPALHWLGLNSVSLPG